MEPITSLTFRGKNGATYKFDVYPKNTRFNRGLALYSFLSKGTDGKYRVLYIGKTTDMDERMSDHHKWDEATRHGFEYIAICRRVTLLSLDFAEANLIQNYRPRCNEVVPHL